MKDISTTNNKSIRGSTASAVYSDLKPLALDPDEYREDLDEFDLTRAQQDEMLAVLWNIMRTFVEIGFGLDSVQVFSTATNACSGEFTGQDSGKLLEKRNNPQQFNRAANPSGSKEA